MNGRYIHCLALHAFEVYQELRATEQRLQIYDVDARQTHLTYTGKLDGQWEISGNK